MVAPGNTNPTLELRPLVEADLPLLHRWLHEPHVLQWWGGDDGAPTLAQVHAHYGPRVRADDGVQGWIAFERGEDGGQRPVGFAQSYAAMADGDGWWKDETDPGMRGIDQFLGDGARLGQGLGTAMVRALVARLFEDPAVTQVQTDPHPTNARAIRCYEKAGFRAVREVVTPDGPALWMVQLRPYVGRFAPSPTGPLHAGSLVAALASWLDARVHGGSWLVRIEDVDGPRCVPGADRLILDQLQRCGLVPDGEVVWQSQRSALYRRALDTLHERGLAYGCACSRRDIEAAWQARGVEPQRYGERVYPGTCRPEVGGLAGRLPRAWRLHTGAPAQLLKWWDRRLGPQQQDVATDVGDFVLLRADGLWAYQLAVVVDDAAQGITHVVRGEDLAHNTARQILLQRALGLPTPEYLHTPLVLATDGHKLSKQNGAQPLALGSEAEAVAELARAGAVLGLGAITGATSASAWLQVALPRWAGIIESFVQPRAQA